VLAVLIAPLVGNRATELNPDPPFPWAPAKLEPRSPANCPSCVNAERPYPAVPTPDVVLARRAEALERRCESCRPDGAPYPAVPTGEEREALRAAQEAPLAGSPEGELQRIGCNPPAFPDAPSARCLQERDRVVAPEAHSLDGERPHPWAPSP
jgi:hypothetical protein